jgi:hypothetical protein
MMVGPTPRNIRERFEEKFIPEPNSGCWLWLACIQGFGYGCFGMGQKREQAHRASLMIYKGADLRGKIVLHKCDTPSCVNPDHLRVGSHADNIRDMHAKGRHAIGRRHGSHTRPDSRVRGARNGNAILTQEQVAAIRECPLPNRQIARLVGVHPGHIGSIKKGESW